jgi:hypothetical protein
MRMLAFYFAGTKGVAEKIKGNNFMINNANQGLKVKN